MRSFLCLLLLTVLTTGFSVTASAQKQKRSFPPLAVTPSPFPTSVTEIHLIATWPDDPLLTALKPEIEKKWLLQGTDWFTTAKSDGLVLHARKLTFLIQPLKLTIADRKDGVQWKGFVSFRWEQERFFLQSKQKWTPWRDGSIRPYRAVLKDQKLDFEEDVPLSHPVSGEVFDLALPEAGQMKTLFGKPVLRDEEIRQIFLRYVFSPQKSSDSEEDSEFQRPKIVYMPKPEYSREARRHQISGNVELKVNIRDDGSVGRVSVMKRLGYGLDENAVKAIKQSIFWPALQDGERVEATVKINVHFEVVK